MPENILKNGFSDVATILSYLVAWLFLGYAGFQVAGWVGAVVTPVVATAAISILSDPVLTLLLVVGVLIRSIQALGEIKRRVFASGGDTDA